MPLSVVDWVLNIKNRFIPFQNTLVLLQSFRNSIRISVMLYVYRIRGGKRQEWREGSGKGGDGGDRSVNVHVLVACNRQLSLYQVLVVVVFITTHIASVCTDKTKIV